MLVHQSMQVATAWKLHETCDIGHHIFLWRDLVRKLRVVAALRYRIIATFIDLFHPLKKALWGDFG